MAAQFLIKYSATAGVVPTSAELPIRQIAINTADGKLFIKKNDGTILTFENSDAFARAVHTHSISDVTGLQDALDTLTSAASAAQSGADASLKIASNLSDLASVSTARTNLGVDSSLEVDSKISTSKSASDAYTDAAIAALINGSPATLDTLKEIADALKNDEDVATALASTVAGVSSRVSTLEDQNLDSRLSTAEGSISTLQSDVVTAQNAANAAQGTADSAVSAAATAQSAAEAAQSTADSAVSAAATAQSGADASVKKAANLSDLADAAASRGNLGVDSSAEVDSKVSTAVSSAQSTLQSNIDGVSSRVSTIEGQNLDSRLSSAEGTIAGLGTMATQDANNVTISGGTFGAGTAPTDSGVILTENSTIDGGTFSGFNGGGGGGGSTPVTALLLHLNGDLTDSSGSAKVITSSGTVSFETSDVMFGGASAYIANASGYLSVIEDSEFAFGTGDFVIECFAKWLNTPAAYQGVFDTRSSSGLYGGMLCYSGGMLRWFDVNCTNILSGLMPTSVWQHIAVARSSGTIRMYVNGAKVGEASDSSNYATNGNPVLFGLIDSTVSDALFDELRIVKGGNCGYTGDSITVPSAELSPV